MNYSHHWGSLNAAEQTIVSLYKSSNPGYGLNSFCYELNDLLRNQQPLSTQLQTAVQLLDGAIRFPTPDPITLYRAIADVSPIIKHSIGGTWVALEYLSTCQTWSRLSTHLKGSNTQAGILTIRVPANIPLLYVDSNPSFGSSEREFLLPRGIQFRMLSYGQGNLVHYLGIPHKFLGLTEVSLEVLSCATPPLITSDPTY
jgi:hypothetical protein